LLAKADLQQKELKLYAKAVENYKLFIHEYPKHTLVKEAYKNLAYTLEKEMDDYPAAIENLQKIVQLYPNDEAALAALQTIARLQEDKLKQPRQAVTSLRKLALTFRTEPKHEEACLDALDDASKLARKKLKDNTLYAEVLTQIVRDFPKSKDAPEALYDLAELTEKDLHNPRGARDLYMQIIKNYPGHKYAKKASKRIY